MRINKVEDKKVNVNLTSDELVMLENVMYFYEEHAGVDKDCSEAAKPGFHNLRAQVITARNLCQYGHLDDFALEQILKQKFAENPNSRLAKALNIEVLED